MGHPYLKKSLVGKMHQYQDVERVMTFVVEHGLIDDSA
jgi:SOS response regulatory protein OraA/RecX